MNNNNTYHKVAILDFDETLILGQSQRLLVEYFFKKGYLSLYKYAVILLWFVFFKFNFSNNIKPIVEFAISCIKDKKVNQISPLFDDFFNNVCIPLIYEDSRGLVDLLKSNGVHTVLVSTAIEPIISRAQVYFNIDEIICTRLELSDDSYTGRIMGEPMFGVNKAKALDVFLSGNNINSDDVFAFADHLTDIEMLSHVGKPFAVNPSTGLLKYAKTNNWSVLYLNNNESFQYFKSHTKF